LKSFKYFVTTISGIRFRYFTFARQRESSARPSRSFLAPNFMVNDSRAHHGGSYFARRTRSKKVSEWYDNRITNYYSS